MQNDVYLILNLVNDKKYVGITRYGYLERWKAHVLDAVGHHNNNVILQNAIRKYGPDNFNIVLICSATSWQELVELETKYIKEYNSHYKDGHGYNMTYGGDGIPGYKHTNQTKDIIRFYSENLSEETKQKRIDNNSRFWEGKELPEDIRNQISKTLSTPVVIDDITYETAAIAAKTLDLNINTLRDRLKRKSFPNYSFLYPPKSTSKPTPVFVRGQIFESAVKAAEFLGITRNSLLNRIKNPKYPDHYYLET